MLLSVNNFKQEYHRDQRTDHNQILSESLFEWGKRCIKFLARSDQNSMATDSSHRVIMGLNGEYGVATFSLLFLTGLSSYLQVNKTMHKS